MKNPKDMDDGELVCELLQLTNEWAAAPIRTKLTLARDLDLLKTEVLSRMEKRRDDETRRDEQP